MPAYMAPEIVNGDGHAMASILYNLVIIIILLLYVTESTV
jgi:hypothetical protein